MDLSKLKQALWAYQKGVSFDEPSHTYFYKHRTLTSVTTVIGYNFPKFDAKNEISRGIAEREGITVKEVKERWREKAGLGTLVHNALELLVYGSTFNPSEYPNGWICSRVSSGAQFLGELAQRDLVLFSEFPVFDGEFSVAGTCDLLVYNSLTGKLDLYDWKTNEKIIPEAVNFGRYGFGRLSHIPDTNFWQYALQLSVYKYILTKAGFDVGDLYLLHLNGEECVKMPVPYLSDEALVVMESNI